MSGEEKNREENQQDIDHSRFWILAGKYTKNHIEILDKVYSQKQRSIVATRIYQAVDIELSERQMRNLVYELDEDDMIDYADTYPSVIVKRETIEEYFDKFIEIWNEVNKF